MSRGSYQPGKQGEQVAWAQNFITVLEPNAAAYGVPAAMVAKFVTLNGQLQAAWTAAKEPTTRTKAAVAEKDNLLKEMRAAAKPMVSIIQGMPGVTDTMLINAGLTVRKTKPTPKPAPEVAPVVTVVAVNGRTVTLRLRQEGDKRAKPQNVASATVLTATGVAKPMTGDDFQFAMNTTQTTVDLPFGPSETGDTVWITAFWNGPRGDTGPAATPISVSLPAGGMITTVQQPKMRIAKAA